MVLFAKALFATWTVEQTILFYDESQPGNPQFYG